MERERGREVERKREAERGRERQREAERGRERKGVQIWACVLIMEALATDKFVFVTSTNLHSCSQRKTRFGNWQNA